MYFLTEAYLNFVYNKKQLLPASILEGENRMYSLKTQSPFLSQIIWTMNLRYLPNKDFNISRNMLYVLMTRPQILDMHATKLCLGASCLLLYP